MSIIYYSGIYGFEDDAFVWPRYGNLFLSLNYPDEIGMKFHRTA